MRIAIGADHGGFNLKEKIVKYLKDNNIEFKDFGTFSLESCHYPQFAKQVAKEVVAGNFDKGILVCGSGIGMSITANRIKGIRAALCWDETTTKLSRQHNNSNLLCLGERVIDNDLAIKMVDLWIKTDFEGERHKIRTDMIED
ncbi:MAG: ribose 5-phosphate isomerase B [Candidatus Gastranaerophilales bacterium]|nr:ribose 5-phosphate isomerase B [Candidatus Gastranaerophilales bacterium]